MTVDLYLYLSRVEAVRQHTQTSSEQLNGAEAIARKANQQTRQASKPTDQVHPRCVVARDWEVMAAARNDRPAPARPTAQPRAGAAATAAAAAAAEHEAASADDDDVLERQRTTSDTAAASHDKNDGNGRFEGDNINADGAAADDDDRLLALAFMDGWCSPATWKRIEHSVLAGAWISFGVFYGCLLARTSGGWVYSDLVIPGFFVALLALYSAVAVEEGTPSWGASFVLLFLLALGVLVVANSVALGGAFFVLCVAFFATLVWILFKEARLRHNRDHQPLPQHCCGHGEGVPGGRVCGGGDQGGKGTPPNDTDDYDDVTAAFTDTPDGCDDDSYGNEGSLKLSHRKTLL
jgi:hypothetical protein